MRTRLCGHCGEPISDARAANAKYCSQACNNTATWERTKARRAAQPLRRQPNPKWQRGADEERQLALRVELEGRLRAIDRRLYAAHRASPSALADN